MTRAPRTASTRRHAVMGLLALSATLVGCQAPKARPPVIQRPVAPKSKTISPADRAALGDHEIESTVTTHEHPFRTPMQVLRPLLDRLGRSEGFRLVWDVEFGPSAPALRCELSAVDPTRAEIRTFLRDENKLVRRSVALGSRVWRYAPITRTWESVQHETSPPPSWLPPGLQFLLSDNPIGEILGSSAELAIPDEENGRPIDVVTFHEPTASTLAVDSESGIPLWIEHTSRNRRQARSHSRLEIVSLRFVDSLPAELFLLAPDS